MWVKEDYQLGGERGGNDKCNVSLGLVHGVA